MKKRNWFTLAFLFIITCIAVLFYNSLKEGANFSEDENTVITYGISPFPDTYMPYLGKIKGWYEEEGLKINFKILGWTEVQEALSSNSVNKIDLGVNNISSVIATHNKNPDLVYYYGNNTFDNGFALMVRPDSEFVTFDELVEQGMTIDEAIENIGRQLKDKEVVTTANTDMEQGVAAVTRRGGLDFLKDVKIINLNPDDGLISFLSGTGDAYIGGIPQRNKAGEQGMKELVTGTNLGPAPINGIVTTKQFVRQNEESLLKILKVWFKIVEYTNDNIDEVAALMVKEINTKTGSTLTEVDFKKFWNNYEHYPSSVDAIQTEILSSSGKNYFKNRWDDCNEYFFKIKKVIPNPVSLEDAFYMGKAQEKLKNYLGEK